MGTYLSRGRSIRFLIMVMWDLEMVRKKLILLKYIHNKINTRHGPLMYNFIHEKYCRLSIWQPFPNILSCYQCLPLDIEAENARSTLSQLPLQKRHDHVNWQMETKNLLGSPGKDLFSPWKERHKEYYFSLFSCFWTYLSEEVMAANVRAIQWL